MTLYKQFSFSGSFRKLSEDDTTEAGIHQANIYCHTDGSIELEISAEEYERISEKRFFESVPLHRSPNLTEEQINDPTFLFSSRFETAEVIREAYEGFYEFNGVTQEGWAVNSILKNHNLTVTFHNEEQGRTEVEQEVRRFVSLRDLYINQNPEISPEGKTQEIKYGLANIYLLHGFSGRIDEIDTEVITIPISRRNETRGVLSAEMTLRRVSEEQAAFNEEEQNLQEDESEPSCLEIYAIWIESLLSFASGRYVKHIYSIKTLEEDRNQAICEYWSGSKLDIGATGRTVIQEAHRHLFMQQCFQHLTQEIFGEAKLGLALGWYLDTFSTRVSEVKLLLQCTVLESLNTSHSEGASRRIIPRSLYRIVRDRIFQAISEVKGTLNTEQERRQYEDFEQKVSQPFRDAYYNQGNLKRNLREMLEFYRVPYRDLFPDLEFIDIRNKIVHEGFSQVNMSGSSEKLSNLVARVFLGMLNYQGSYMEYRRMETSGIGIGRYGLTCKSFPFTIPEANSLPEETVSNN
jgi:hypothetical protein